MIQTPRRAQLSNQLSAPRASGVRRHRRYTAPHVRKFHSAASRGCVAVVALEQVHARTARKRTTGRPVEFLFGRWQSGSAPEQGCTTRAEAYACTLQIVVPLADRAPGANGLCENSNPHRKGEKRGQLDPPDRIRTASLLPAGTGPETRPEFFLHDLMGWCMAYVAILAITFPRSAVFIAEIGTATSRSCTTGRVSVCRTK